MVSALGIQATFVQENIHKFVDILQLSAPGKIVLPINKVILETTSLMPMTKYMDKRHIVPMQSFKCFFSHPPQNSLVVMTANEKVRQGRYKSTPKGKELKRLDLMVRKADSNSPLQMHIANEQALNMTL